jgi:hypothetical protein
MRPPKQTRLTMRACRRFCVLQPCPAGLSCRAKRQTQQQQHPCKAWTSRSMRSSCGLYQPQRRWPRLLPRALAAGVPVLAVRRGALTTRTREHWSILSEVASGLAAQLPVRTLSASGVAEQGTTRTMERADSPGLPNDGIEAWGVDSLSESEEPSGWQGQGGERASGPAYTYTKSTYEVL